MTSRPKCAVDGVGRPLAMSRGGRNMGTMSTKAGDSFGFLTFPSAEAAGAAALDFLERSRDVANEVVVDGKRGETSTSGREENSPPRSGFAV